MEGPVVTNFIRGKCSMNDSITPYLQGWSSAETNNTPVVLLDVQVGANSTRTKNVFYLNSIESPRVVLKRTTRYKLIVNTPGHPFYFSSDASGNQKLTKPMEGGSVLLETSKFPSTFYYQCSNHSMTGRGKLI